MFHVLRNSCVMESNQNRIVEGTDIQESTENSEDHYYEEGDGEESMLGSSHGEIHHFNHSISRQLYRCCTEDRRWNTYNRMV